MVILQRCGKYTAKHDQIVGFAACEPPEKWKSALSSIRATAKQRAHTHSLRSRRYNSRTL